MRNELGIKCPYQTKIEWMKLELPELQAKNPQAQKMRSENSKTELKESVEDIETILHYKTLLYVSAII